MDTYEDYYAPLSEPIYIEELFANVDKEVERNFRNQVCDCEMKMMEMKRTIDTLTTRVEELEKMYKLEHEQNKSLMRDTISMQARIDAQKKKSRRDILKMF